MTPGLKQFFKINNFLQFFVCKDNCWELWAPLAQQAAVLIKITFNSFFVWWASYFRSAIWPFVYLDKQQNYKFIYFSIIKSVTSSLVTNWTKAPFLGLASTDWSCHAMTVSTTNSRLVQLVKSASGMNFLFMGVSRVTGRMATTEDPETSISLKTFFEPDSPYSSDVKKTMGWHAVQFINL